MNTLDRLKELNATTGKRNADEDLGHWADRSKRENLWVRDIALPLLLEVAEAARYLQHAENRCGFELDYADVARAKNNLKAALAKLTEEV